jgi:hypothetical protein
MMCKLKCFRILYNVCHILKDVTYCGLFDASFSFEDDRKIDQRLIGKDLEGTSRGFIEVLSQHLLGGIGDSDS